MYLVDLVSLSELRFTRDNNLCVLWEKVEWKYLAGKDIWVMFGSRKLHSELLKYIVLWFMKTKSELAKKK